MILIAESGSTNTDWVILDKEIKHTFKTSGINPYLMEGESVLDLVNENFPKDFKPEYVSKFFFYGPGCSSRENIQKLSQLFLQIFPNSIIEINTDILGASRALFGDSKGIVGILGTGSNVCYYNGVNTSFLTPSLGYILGDEGSGNHMGRLLLQDVLYKNAPEKIIQAFGEKYGYQKDDVLDCLYKKEYPNRFLASFTEFILEHNSDEYIEMLVERSFDELFVKHISKYSDYDLVDLGFVGSVAFLFNKQLSKLAKKYGFVINEIIKEPIGEIVSYHEMGQDL